LEIYNDQMFDLLKPMNRINEPLIIGEDANVYLFIIYETDIFFYPTIINVLEGIFHQGLN
jgi:hypothetical protein